MTALPERKKERSSFKLTTGDVLTLIGVVFILSLMGALLGCSGKNEINEGLETVRSNSNQQIAAVDEIRERRAEVGETDTFRRSEAGDDRGQSERQQSPSDQGTESPEQGGGQDSVVGSADREIPDRSGYDSRAGVPVLLRS